MEHSYAEANVRKKTSAAVIALKAILIIILILIFMLSMMLGSIGRFIILVGVAGIFFLVWYWPRFRVEWEYVFCDGQLDFDMIQGGERRKNVLRIEIEEADAIAPMSSLRMDGYRHLTVKDYSSRKKDANVYGIATRLSGKEDKIVILFEPSERMLELMYTKCPNIVEKSDRF